MYCAYDRHALDLADVLEQAMTQSLETNPDMRFYALIDSAFAPKEVVSLLDKAAYRQTVSIYVDTPLRDFEELSPILVPMPQDEAERQLAIADWLALCNGKPMLSFIASALSLSQLKQHFSAFLQVRDDSNMRYVLRFADTCMTSAILNCLHPEQKQAWLAGMAAWWLIGRDGSLQLLGGIAVSPVVAQPNDWHDQTISDAQLIRLHQEGEADGLLSNLYGAMPKPFTEHRPSVLYQQTSKLLEQLDRQQIHDDQMRLEKVAALLIAQRFG